MLGRSTRPGSRRGAAVVSAPEPRPQSGSALRGSPASDCAPSGSACLTALCPPHCRRVRMRTAGLAPAPEDSNRRPPCETQTSIQLVLKTGALKNEGKDRSFYTKRTFLRFQAAPTCPPHPRIRCRDTWWGQEAPFPSPTPGLAHPKNRGAADSGEHSAPRPLPATRLRCPLPRHQRRVHRRPKHAPVHQNHCFPLQSVQLLCYFLHVLKIFFCCLNVTNLF